VGVDNSKLVALAKCSWILGNPLVLLMTNQFVVITMQRWYLKTKRELSFMNYIGENPNRHHAPRTTDLEVILYLAYTGIF